MNNMHGAITPHVYVDIPPCPELLGVNCKAKARRASLTTILQPHGNHSRPLLL